MSAVVVDDLVRLSAITAAAVESRGTCVTWTVHPRKLATMCRAPDEHGCPPVTLAAAVLPAKHHADVVHAEHHVLACLQLWH
jgi:hypothetical protein